MDTNKTDILFRHRARPDWGYAIYASAREDKHEYQFEDGKLRVFKTEFLHLLEEVDPFQAGFDEILESLRRRLGWKVNVKPTKVNRKVEGLLFDHQIALFKELYPKGFQGKKWAREKRGIDVQRQLKRHREITLIEAQKLFDKDRLELLIKEGEFATVVESLRKIVSGTDLITKAKVRALDNIDGEHAEAVAQQLNELLHGEGSDAIGFERFVDALSRATGKKPGWQLATLFRALVHPKQHLCVKPRTMRTQAASLESSLKLSSMPNAPKYERMRSLALEVRQRLVDEGLKPRDLIDIYDFMETTLAPKALEQLKSIRISGSSKGEQAAA